jgi:DNA topoisomerase-3
MNLIIAEKPSVARDIARIVGAKNTKKIDEMTYYTGENYAVGNFLGHLVGLALPPDYDKKYEKWDLADLPIIPQNWLYNANSETKKHLKSLIKLMNSKEITTIVNAADAGREGECIFMYVYNYANCKKPIKRLWISSLTDESIQKGLANLQDGKTKESLFLAGSARAKADWLIGMNLSRFYTKIFNTKLSVGRVTTPTLAMIANRDSQINGFSKAKYYTLSLENGAEYFVEDGESFFSEKSSAEKICAICTGKNITVKKVDIKRKKENRPLLHSLTSLQKEANEKHGFTAEQTLDNLQKLYEKKLVTYPRTDSNCITDDMKSTILDIVKSLEFYDSKRIKSLLSQGLNLDKRVVDNSKVSDHHAVIPTKEISRLDNDKLSENEKKIAELVINRFLIALDKPHIFDEKTHIFEVEKHLFKLVSKTSIDLGFRNFEKVSSKNSEQKLSFKKVISYNLGDLFLSKILVTEKETSPPKAFTESTLLSAMENISRKIEDKNKAEFVKERGLGTPATRAGIIEELVKRGLAERNGKNFTSTALGKQIISLLPAEVKSVGMTADMEEKLSQIENEKLSEMAFLSEIITFINTRISAEKGKTYTQFAQPQNARETLGKCPECGANVVENEKSFYCSSYKNCNFSIWKDNNFCKNFGFKLNKTTVKQILAKGSVLAELNSKSGKKFKALVMLEKVEKNGKVYFNFKFEYENEKK